LLAKFHFGSYCTNTAPTLYETVVQLSIFPKNMLILAEKVHNTKYGSLNLTHFIWNIFQCDAYLMKNKGK